MMRQGEFRDRGFAPVQVGEELDVVVEAVGEKGDGIVRKKGFVLFVPNVKEGDEVRIRVTKVLRKVGFAEVIGEPQGEVKRDEPPRAQAAPAPMPEPEPSPEDSEDFGEEIPEAPDEKEAPAPEEPAEETASEEPAEEIASEEPDEVSEPEGSEHDQKSEISDKPLPAEPEEEPVNKEEE